MKKAERIVSYLLVLALVTSLLTGLGFAKSDTVDAKAAGNTLNVLEIVPTSDMATFGYMVKSWTDSNFASKVAAVGSGKYDSFKTYIQNAGLGTVSSSTLTSTDYFKTQVLGLAADDALTINVTTKTPNDSDLISAVNSADFIVINQTVPSALQYGTQKKFSDSGYGFTNAQVLAIFKKIAGVEGQTPVPYIIDFTLMNRGAVADVRTHNSVFSAFTSKTGALFGYLSADKLLNGDQGIGVGQGVAMKYGTDSYLYYGTDSTSYKLYKLLSSIDPATLYGLYFKESDGSYGIDKDLNQLVCGPDIKGSLSDGEASLYALNTKLSYWSDLAFRPYFLTTSQKNIGNVMSTMGWNEDVTSSDASSTIKNKTVGNFLKVIGGQDGRGAVYNSADGLFYATEAIGVSTVDLSALTDISSSVSVNYVGSVYWGEVKITNNTSSTLSNWKVTFEKDGFEQNTGNLDSNIGYVDSGSTITLYVKPGCTYNINGNSTTGKVTAGTGVGSGDNDTYPLTTVASTSSSGKKVGKIVNSFRTLGSAKNDYHPYRIMIISENLPDVYANRNAIANIVKAANEEGKGLAGGVFIECVSRPQFDDIPIGTVKMYDMICTVGDLASGSVGKSKLDSFAGTKLSLSVGNNGSAASIASTFKSSLLGHKMGVDYITVPTEYYTDFSATFTGENGWTSYFGTGSKTVPGNANYINDNNHTGKRTLDFRFKVTGVSSYSADLYVDVDGDFKYEDDEKVSLTVNSSNNNYNSIPLSDPKFFGEGGDEYVGGFSWKLVVKSGSESVSRIGYSAIRNETTNKNVIKILQIYPTDYTGSYTNEDYPNPSLILPTRTEIETAISSKGQISSFNMNTDSGVNSLKNYFNNILNIEQCSSVTDGVPGGISEKKYVVSSGGTDFRDKLVYNASLLYYFLDQLQDYDIDVTRYSVNQFNYAAQYGQILYDSETGRLAKGGGADGEGIKNLDGSDRYGYTAAELNLTSGTWNTETVTWTEGVFKKYLISEGTSYIYGYRGTADGEVHYYASGVNGYPGKRICKLDKNNEFDLVMIGFGNSLDWMHEDAVKLLRDYLTNGGPAFVGNGAVSRESYNTFGKDSAIRSALGISTTPTRNYQYQEEFTKPLVTTNDTIFSHYPYTINKSMKASGDGKQPYKLTLTGSVDDPIVAFSKYICNDYDDRLDYDIYNYAIENYYVYKKNSIVFCGFGNPTPTSELKQQGGVLPMAETLMIVNALVASSRFGSSPIPSDPYIDCKDDDASVLNVTGLEDDQIETNTDGDKIWYFKDSVYTDYDAYDIAAFAKDDAQRKFNSPVQNSGLGIPGVNVTADGWTSNIRWIPYLADIPTEAGGYIEFKTVNGATTLNLKVWSVANNAFVTPEDGKYHVNRNGMYYIGVPLNGGHSAYAGASKLGFMIDKDNPDNSIDMFAIRMNLYKPNKTVLVERHTISMIRRVLYHAK